MTQEQLHAAEEAARESISGGWPDDDLATIDAKNVLTLLEERASLLDACKALLDCAHDPECPNCQDAHRQGEAAILKTEGKS